MKSEMKIHESDFESIFFRKMDRANLINRLYIMWRTLFEDEEVISNEEESSNYGNKKELK